MAINDLLVTQTFRDWFNKTNEIIDFLNSQVVGNGTIANGNFVVNGSLQVINTFLANSTIVQVSGNTTLAANTTVTGNCNVWNFACGSLLIQPLNGTTVNSGMLWTAAAPATFLGFLTANANVTITADISANGNTLLNGTLTSNAGPAIVRQVLMASSNAMCQPAGIGSPELDDYAPTGLNESSILNLTPNIDVTVTGIVAPTNFSVGGRVLYIQNLGTSFNVTLASANLNSQAANRFKFPNDVAVVITPGAALAVIWTSNNQQWRALAPQSTQVPNLTVSGLTNLQGNVIVGGWLNVVHQLVVQGNSAVTGNLTQTGNATFSGYINTAGTLQVAGNSSQTGNATFGGYINIASSIQAAGVIVGAAGLNISGAPSVFSANLAVSGVAALSNTQIAGSWANLQSNTTIGANAILNGTKTFANGQLRCDTTNGRLVLPVGSNLWAT